MVSQTWLSGPHMPESHCVLIIIGWPSDLIICRLPLVTGRGRGEGGWQLNITFSAYFPSLFLFFFFCSFLLKMMCPQEGDRLSYHK